MAVILIVEDRPLDREFLAVLLKSAGHAVTEASDGAEGLRVACDTLPDLIISDIMMPTVDGFEFVRRLRDVQILARTPVIFYTATYHAREARVLALQCGAEILIKPSDYGTILAKVDAALESVGTPPPPIPDPARFSRDHLQVVSSALESKIQDFEASEHRMAAIVGFAQQIAAEHEADALLSKVCAAAREVTLAQDCVVTMLNDDRSVFRRVATGGIDGELLGQVKVRGVDGPAFTRAIADRRPVRMENPEGRPEALGLPDDHPPTYSFLVVPIASPSLVYGCLSLRNKLGAKHFSDRDEDVALTLATHAGIAYENAQRYDDLRRRSAALEQEVAERRHVEARTQLALTASRMGVWELDLTADRLQWSDSMAAIFGLSPAQAPTTRAGFTAVIHPDDRAAARVSVDRAIREKTDIVNEFRTIWPDGTVHWIAGRARLVTDQEGNATRVIGVGMDIGERKSLEEQLRQGHKMEAIGQLAGGVAHDFNNLLTVIHGYADLVLTTMTTGDPRRGDVDEIVKAAARAAGLTRQLLAFSRKQVLQPTLVDVNTLVGNTCGMLRRLIGEDVELVTNLAPDLDSVYADAGQLEQILMNLAINARDAMPQGGRLSIETAAVALDDSSAMHHAGVKPGSYVMLAVVDNGTDARADLRALLYDERGWTGDWPRPGDCLRYRPAERWIHFGRDQAWMRRDVQGLFAGRRGAFGRRDSTGRDRTGADGIGDPFARRGRGGRSFPLAYASRTGRLPRARCGRSSPGGRRVPPARGRDRSSRHRRHHAWIERAVAFRAPLGGAAVSQGALHVRVPRREHGLPVDVTLEGRIPAEAIYRRGIDVQGAGSSRRMTR